MHEAAHWFRQRAWNIPERGGAEASYLNVALAVAAVMHALILIAVSRMPDTVHVPLEVEMLDVRPAVRERATLPPPPPPAQAIIPKAVPATRAAAPLPAAQPAQPVPAAPREYTPLVPSRISGEPARAGLGAPVLPPRTADRAESGPERPVTSPAVADARQYRGAPATAAPDNTAAVKAGYQEALRVCIEKRKDYPLFARKSRQEGTCLVVCEIARDGTVRDVRLIKASGHGLLDKAAMRAVGDVGRFPPVPPELKGDTLSFEVPVSFRLNAD